MSTFIVDNLKGKTTDKIINVFASHDSGTTTTNLEQGLLKAWTVSASSSAGTVGDSFNNSSFSDDNTGRTTITLTNPMNSATDWCVTQGTILQYPYHGYAKTASTFGLETVNSSGNYADASSNGMCSGDLA